MRPARDLPYSAPHCPAACLRVIPERRHWKTFVGDSRVSGSNLEETNWEIAKDMAEHQDLSVPLAEVDVDLAGVEEGVLWEPNV